MDRNIIFKCPQTGMNVQHWLTAVSNDLDIKNMHVSVQCPACTKLHFINSATGRLLGEASR